MQQFGVRYDPDGLEADPFVPCYGFGKPILELFAEGGIVAQFTDSDKYMLGPVLVKEASVEEV